MARHDITAQVQRIFALGGTESQVLAAGPRVVSFHDGTWYADNRVSCSGIDRLEQGLKARAEKERAAKEIVAKISEGKVLYTRTAEGRWLVWGREDVIVSGAVVEAERRNGSTQRIVITSTGPTRERDGLRYRTAEFRQAALVTEVDPMAEIGLTGAAAEAERIGRSYGVNGQVWDNA
jgi:hypothetical protein